MSLNGIILLKSVKNYTENLLKSGIGMLYRKIETVIEEHLKSDSKKILLIDGARQVGKTYIIRYVGKKIFKNFMITYNHILLINLYRCNFKNYIKDKQCSADALIQNHFPIFVEVFSATLNQYRNGAVSLPTQERSGWLLHSKWLEITRIHNADKVLGMLKT